MTTPWYTPTGEPPTSTLADSKGIRDEFTTIETAMDKLPAFSGNGSKIVAVNSGATALEAIASVGVAQGGTGAITLTDGGVLLGSGTGAITAMSVLADSEMIVGNGTTDPVAESGATLRTSIGVAIGTDVQAFDAELTEIAALANTDGNFIVGDGAAWIAESGATLRTSIGVGTGDSPTFTALTLTGTTAVDLSDNGNPFNIGTLAGAHIALSPAIVQAKASATAVAALGINSLGGAVTIGDTANDGAITIAVAGAATFYNAGVAQARTETYGVTILDGAAANNTRVEFGTTLRAWYGFNSADVLEIRNFVDGAQVRILGDDAGGTSRLMFSGDPDTTTLLYGAGTLNITIGASTLGFYGTAAASQPTGVAVTDAAIHAALVTLGLITA